MDDSTIWQRMCKHKQPVIEPRQSSNFPNAIEVLRSFISSHLNFELFISSDNSIPCDLQDYEAKLRDPSTFGAIFFAVCRGKVCSCSFLQLLFCIVASDEILILVFFC